MSACRCDRLVQPGQLGADLGQLAAHAQALKKVDGGFQLQAVALRTARFLSEDALAADELQRIGL